MDTHKCFFIQLIETDFVNDLSECDIKWNHFTQSFYETLSLVILKTNSIIVEKERLPTMLCLKSLKTLTFIGCLLMTLAEL